jgi:hypothetical protein
VTDTERLQKLADMMELSYGSRDTGLWTFPLGAVHSNRECCTLDDLRAFIDSDFQEQE